jgi:hypothetical protein
LGSKSDRGSEDGRSDDKSAGKEFRFESQATLPELHPADTVKDPLLRKTFDLWLALKGDRAMPSRAQITPRQLKHDLRCIHMYDVLPGRQDFRARLVGTGVFPGLDRDQTGRLVSEHPDPGVRLRFAAILRHVVETAAPIRSLSLRLTGHPLHDMRTEGLWVPLGDAGEVEIVLAHSSLTPIEPD